MYRKRSKRTQRILFILTYTLVPLLIVGIVTLLVFLIQGYRFNTKNNQVYQAGLVQFGTAPNGATVTVDGAALASKTRTRINVSSGQRTFGMARPQYLPWQKTVTVEPGSVLWLTYARLVPETVNVQSIYNYSSSMTGSALAHKDAHLLGFLADASTPTFTTIQTSGTSTRSLATLPASLYNASPKQSFAAVTWGESDRYVILRQTVAKNATWFILDREDATKSINLSTASKLTISSVFFDASDDKYVYLLANNSLFQYDRSRNSLSSALASDVVSASCSNEGIVTIVSRSKSGETTMSYVTHAQQKARTLTAPSSKPVLATTMVTYDRRQYVALLTSGLLSIAQVSLGSSSDADPVALNVVRSVAVPASMKTLANSPNGRFVIARDGQKLRTYDFELNVLSTFELTAQTSELRWLDDHHLIDRVDEKLAMLEFDGGNLTPITAVDTQFAAVLSSDEKYLYCLQKTADGFAVIRATMIL